VLVRGSHVYTHATLPELWDEAFRLVSLLEPTTGLVRRSKHNPPAVLLKLVLREIQLRGTQGRLC
jgi:hypothetical protein